MRVSEIWCWLRTKRRSPDVRDDEQLPRRNIGQRDIEPLDLEYNIGSNGWHTPLSSSDVTLRLSDCGRPSSPSGGRPVSEVTKLPETSLDLFINRDTTATCHRREEGVAVEGEHAEIGPCGHVCRPRNISQQRNLTHVRALAEDGDLAVAGRDDRLAVVDQIEVVAFVAGMDERRARDDRTWHHGRSDPLEAWLIQHSEE